MPPKPDKRAKIFSSRTIRTQNNDPALKDGVLDVPSFISAREFEIKSMEMAQLKSKYASSTRCFQSLPRLLRRRTASHNVKRIPKRLRNRAIREMQNSTNGVPPKPKFKTGRALYRLKMSTKLLKLASRIKLLRSIPEVKEKLPVRKQIRLLQAQIAEIKTDKAEKAADLDKKTKVTTTENTQITTEKIDNNSIDGTKPASSKKIPKISSKLINNTVGAYDNSAVHKLAPKPKGSLKYTKRQQEFVWLPTHIWHSKRAHLIKRHGYQIPLRPTQKCYKRSDRASRQGTIMYDTSYMDCLVINTVDTTSLATLLLKLTQKSLFKVRSGEKLYFGWLYIGDTAVGKGMVLCRGKKVLIRVFPSVYEELFVYVSGLLLGSVEDCRYALGSIELAGPKAVESMTKVFHVLLGPASSSWLKLASFLDSNQTIPTGTTYSFSIDDPRKWIKPSNFPKYEGDYNDLLIKVRTASSVERIDSSIDSLLSSEGRQESYKDQMSIKELSQYDAMLKRSVSYPKSCIPLIITKLEVNWCVILPWHWVLPVWFQLSKVTGVLLGGLEQLRQINFENQLASYPEDYPFLRDGYLENEFNTLQREKKWALKPASHKIDYYKLGIEVDNFHGPDWRFLQLLTFGLEWWKQRQARKAVAGTPETSIPRSSERTIFNDNMERQLDSIEDLLQLIRGAKQLDEEKKARGAAVEVPIVKYSKELVERIRNAPLSLDSKFPRLPVYQVSLLVDGKGHPSENARIYRHIKSVPLKDSLQIENLVGYVTTASYNLKLGKSSAIGCISALLEILELVEVNGLVVLRNMGASEPMLATLNVL